MLRLVLMPLPFLIASVISGFFFCGANEAWAEARPQSSKIGASALRTYAFPAVIPARSIAVRVKPSSPPIAASAPSSRLARVTAYWAGEGDFYTRKNMSSTGVRLHRGICAVDPAIIPYGSRVSIAGVGEFIAADTGSAVISRKAARQLGKTLEEKKALVIDLFFERACDAHRFLDTAPRFAAVHWLAPGETKLSLKTALMADNQPAGPGDS